MNENIKDLLPNPFAVDYQYPEGPLDLYTEKELEVFASKLIKLSALFVETCSEVYNQAEQNACVRSAKGLRNFFGVTDVEA